MASTIGKYGARVGAEIGLEIQVAARQQDGDAVIADRPGEQDLVAGTNGCGVDVDPVDEAADSGGGDVHAVGFAVLDHFGVAADHRDAGAFQAASAMARTSASRTGSRGPLRERR